MSTLDTPLRVHPRIAVHAPRVRRSHVLVLTFLLLAGLVASMSVSATAAGKGGASVSTGPAPDMEDEFLRLLNGERVAVGLAPLARVEGVNNFSREWADTMARDQKLYHRSSLSAGFDGEWWKLGENVGVGYGPNSLHQGFMNSEGHKANVLGDYEYVGIGVALSGSRTWVAFNFVRGEPSTLAKYGTNPITGYAVGAGGGGPFYDTDDNTHETSIDKLEAAGLVVSCAGNRYCPDEPVRRADMAAMLVTALNLPPATEQFTDVSSSHHYAAEIGALAAARITLGCNPPANDRFCPDELVTRQQMASFFVRALELEKSNEAFADVASSNRHAQDIGGLADSRITLGCNPPDNDEYCPEALVTRGQIASFLARGLQL